MRNNINYDYYGNNYFFLSLFVFSNWYKFFYNIIVKFWEYNLIVLVEIYIKNNDKNIKIFVLIFIVI